jgi:Transposase DDE domain
VAGLAGARHSTGSSGAAIAPGTLLLAVAPAGGGPGDGRAAALGQGRYKRRATKWRCPTGQCKPALTWIKADRLHPLIPRDSERSAKLYRSRGAVEREFGRLKHEWALLPLRVRGLDRVRLHADLTILAKLATALSRSRAVPLAA